MDSSNTQTAPISTPSLGRPRLLGRLASLRIAWRIYLATPIGCEIAARRVARDRVAQPPKPKP